jgi:NAD(P)-dependent dehydrogenase (short-subunit alcohol dehydrogenase family)
MNDPKKGIRVNAIWPGFIDMGLTKQVVAKKAHLEEIISAGRFGEEGEVSESSSGYCPMRLPS